jgi:hypothetical protein
MGAQRVQMKGVLPWLVRWACCAGTRNFCPALAALVGPVQNIFSSPYAISINLSSSPQQAGQAVVLGRLSLSNVSLAVTLLAQKGVPLECGGKYEAWKIT